MTRSIKTAHRPEPHLFDPDPDLGRDYNGRRFCRCALREDDSVHVTSEQLVEGLGPNPIADVDDRILGDRSNEMTGEH